MKKPALLFLKPLLGKIDLCKYIHTLKKFKMDYSEECADKIIADWSDRITGKELIIFGDVFKITGLYKDDLLNGYFKVMVDTGTPHTGELKDTLYSLMLLDLIDQYDWALCQWK